jgi:endonuclease III
MGHLDPFRISGMNIEQFKRYFTTPSKLHRFWPTMARRIHNASNLIVTKYRGSAANIWSDEPDARILFDRLCEFDGVGQKKASMAVNILSRDLGVKIGDKSGIDGSYDIMVRRVFLRTGLAKSDSLKEIVEAARELNPSYPGELDYPAWIIGRTWCLPQRPKCSECEIFSTCLKIKVE